MLGCDNYQSYLPVWSEEQWWLWWSTSLTCSCPGTLLCGGGAPSKWNGKLSQLAPHLTVWRAIFKIVNIFINAEWAGCSSCIRQPYNVLPYNCIKKNKWCFQIAFRHNRQGTNHPLFFSGTTIQNCVEKTCWNSLSCRPWEPLVMGGSPGENHPPAHGASWFLPPCN